MEELREHRPAMMFVWAVLVIVAGAGGAMGAIAIGGKGTYDMPPFRVEMKAWPASSGKTEVAIAAPIIGRAHAEAGTHSAPMDFRLTIIGVSRSATSADLAALKNPRDLVKLLGEKDSAAVRSFAIKLGLLGLGGAALGGVVVSFGRWRRILAATIIGIIAVALVGVAVRATYDADAFSKTHFFVDHGSLDILPSVLPTL